MTFASPIKAMECAAVIYGGHMSSEGDGSGSIKRTCKQNKYRGPLFNSSGEVIGITQASLDPKVAIGTFGTLPQNVNYAIKSSYISALLPTN
jgi:hypothetical protein